MLTLAPNRMGWRRWKSLWPLLLLGLPSGTEGAAGWEEDFGSDPLAGPWRVFGNAALFSWDAALGVLQVTWDSREPNSMFYRPLGTILGKSDDFEFACTLRMEEITSGIDPEKPFTFELALGLVRVSDVMRTNFFRGAGRSLSRGPNNLVEFDYFPDSGFGATWAPTVVSSNNVIVFSDNHPLEMTLGDVFELAMTYTASDQVLRLSVLRNGLPFGLGDEPSFRELSLDGVPDFRVDAFSVTSYSHDGQASTEFAGSILARGSVDRVRVTVPDPPVRNLHGFFQDETWTVRFGGQSNWVYTLQRSSDATSWHSLQSTQAIATGELELADDEAAWRGAAFYRIEAERP